MFKNYIKIAWRHLQKDATTSFINIFGLALAIAITLLLSLYIRHESNYDNWYDTDDNIYRVYRHWGNEGKNWVWTPGVLSETLDADFPEVTAAAHIGPMNEVLLTVGEKQLYIDKAIFVDSSFFNTIPFPFQAGDRATALNLPNSIVLTSEIATLFFGQDNPIGQTMLLNGTDPIIVTGIVAKGGNTHLARKVYLRQNFPNFGWLNNSFATYVRLHPSTDIASLSEKVKTVINPNFEASYKELGQEYNKSQLSDWAFQPIEEVHLNSQNFVAEEVAGMGDVRYLYLLGLIAAILLMLAIFNYTNLSIAQASMRAKEIGVRKVSGALQHQVIRQFLVESTLQSFLALGIGGLLAYALLPTFQNLMEVNFHLEWGVIIPFLPWLLLGGLIMGLLAGIYPALVLASMKPQRVFTPTATTTNRFGLRQILVIAQFVVVITMLTAITFITQQVDYMLSQDLGFKGDQVITIPMTQNYTRARLNSITPAVLSIPGISAMGISSHVPGEDPYNWSLFLKDKKEAISTNIVFANEGVLDTWDLKLQQGRNFSTTRPSDSLNFIVNEAFLKKYKIEDPLNTPMRFFADSAYHSIVGVISDYHQNSLDQQIEPLVISGATTWNTKASLKIAPQNMPATLQQLEQFWQTIEPNRPMRYTFLDASFAQQYGQQVRFKKGLSYATALTIFIAMLGLFGLATFAIQRRRKEIGIRKVLGASVWQVVGQLNKDFLKLVVIALVFAIPLAWYVGNRWLENFPYRIEMQWWVFALTGLAAIGLATITVSFQSVRAALVNPVEALKKE